MLARWPIRYKLFFGVVTLSLIVALLAFSGFRGVYAYRTLASTITHRAAEMPSASELTQAVHELRFSFKRVGLPRDIPSLADSQPGYMQYEFRNNLTAVRNALDKYKKHLTSEQGNLDPRIGDLAKERGTVQEIERSLETIDRLHHQEDWVFDQVQYDLLGDEIERLYQASSELPAHLQRRMSAFRDEVRGQYRIWIVMTWAASILAAVMMITLGALFYVWVVRPLRVLIRSSRCVAGGDFDHRVQIDSHDEMAEMARALNAMTSRFQEIREDLKRQVQQRTKEVVRSEQLASVGFLAAGVAHEINNPLASIAMASESLESRVEDVFEDDALANDPELAAEVDVIKDYLRKIQKEAFRCKGITERLLDFSRMSDVERHDTDMRSLVQDVIDMVQHLGQYRRKHIVFRCERYVSASVNEQEIKQVVLNLITNALDSLEPDGTVEVTLNRTESWAELIVQDNGCGMDEDVLEQLYEPFFTRRRNGQGTGLGLSITYRIVTDHGGSIAAHSDGPGTGSCFRVTLPLTSQEMVHEKVRQVA